MSRVFFAVVVLALTQDALGFGMASLGGVLATARPAVRSSGRMGATLDPVVARSSLLLAGDSGDALVGRGRVGVMSTVMMGSKMPRRRRGKGPQRSRWAARDVSDDPDAPQRAADQAGNRMEKIEALVKRKHDGLIVVLEDPYDEGNAGAVIRSCDAFGVTEVWFVHNGIDEGTSMRKHVERYEDMDLDSTDMMKSSSSATRWMVCRTLRSTQTALDELQGTGYRQFATCFTDKSVSLYNTDISTKKMALWVGNEYEGLSDLAIEGCDVELFIPMRGMIQSLNLSVATAVCLSEVCRQRATSDDPDDYALPEETQRKMAGALSLKRRNYRQRNSSQKVVARQAKTWDSVVGRSNKPQRDGPRPDPRARGDTAVEVEAG